MFGRNTSAPLIVSQTFILVLSTLLSLSIFARATDASCVKLSLIVLTSLVSRFFAWPIFSLSIHYLCYHAYYCQVCSDAAVSQLQKQSRKKKATTEEKQILTISVHLSQTVAPAHLISARRRLTGCSFGASIMAKEIFTLQ